MFDDFIENYTQDQFHKICFLRAEEGNDNCFDENEEIRSNIISRILKNNIEVSIILIRDLFQEETIYSREIWAAHPYLDPLGRMLLELGGKDYVYDFIKGKFQSFDTECAIGKVKISNELCSELIRELKRLKSSSKDELDTELLDAGILYFEEVQAFWKDRI